LYYRLGRCTTKDKCQWSEIDRDGVKRCTLNGNIGVYKAPVTTEGRK
jgi:hypothetical protein